MALCCSDMQGGPSVRRRRLHIRAVVQKQRDDIPMPFRRCDEKWGCTVIPLRLLHVRPVLQQQSDNLRMPLLGCDKKWRFTVVCPLLLHIRPLVQEQLYDGSMPQLCCNVECGRTVCRHVLQVCAFVQEQRHDDLISLLSRIVEGSLAVLVCHVDIGLLLDENLHQTGIPVGRRFEQCVIHRPHSQDHGHESEHQNEQYPSFVHVHSSLYSVRIS